MPVPATRFNDADLSEQRRSTGMIYTKNTIRRDLQQINALGNGFLWGGGPAIAGMTRPDVAAKNPRIGQEGPDGPSEIIEYCWTVYQAAHTAAGDQVIGRVNDIHDKLDFYRRLCNLRRPVGGVPDRTTNHDAGTRGNLLHMDKWTLCMNDSWILGGVHRRANFRLVSNLTLANLWNAAGYFVVTAREIRGLLNFGYQLKQAGPYKMLMCTNRVRAMTADLIKYHRIMSGGAQTLANAMAMADPTFTPHRVNAQIAAFQAGNPL
ncbi:MAG: hypothetical protein AAFQ71_15480 [Planctomycetota bacterium]